MNRSSLDINSIILLKADNTYETDKVIISKLKDVKVNVSKIFGECLW